ncbi:MAG: hypothetical protein HYU39_03740 [Thaumarchaeota archaeon]|nr:hypothetical protein [Nitrososphaerota archaeon]
MSEYVTVSVKVKKEVKEKMTRLKVKWGEILRQAIEQELQRTEREKAVNAILKLAEKAPRTEPGTTVKLVKETRRTWKRN